MAEMEQKGTCDILNTLTEGSKKKKITKLIILTFLCFLLAGCQSYDIQLVSDQYGSPTNAITPHGFTVSPVQAYEVVWEKPWALSIKHIWHIYADDENYYIIDSFLGSSQRKAIKTGIIIDGQTGGIKERLPNK